MAESVFREDKLKKLSSPERIDEYIKTTTPSVWLVIAAMLVILIGALVWGFFGEITVTTAEGVQTVAPISYLLP